MKKTFMRGAVILGVSGMLIKLLGAFFRIPLANWIGDTGMGYYHTAYPVYVLLLTLSTAGLPTAIARLVSERTAENNHSEAYRIFKLSFLLMMSIGIISFIIFFLITPMFLSMVKEPKALLAMRAIAPALILVPAMTAFRGYFQGLQDMTPTAMSQVFGQLARVVAGLGLAWLLVDFGLEYAAAGATFGATVDAIFGTCIIAGIFFYRRPKILERCSSTAPDAERESAPEILKTVMWIAVPITIGAAIMPIMSNIDLVIVMRRLVSTGYNAVEANRLYGQLSGFAAVVANFPPVLTQALAASIVPAIAAARREGDLPFLKYNVVLGMRTAMLTGMPCAAGIFVLARPIMMLLYPQQQESALNAAACLEIFAIGVLFLSAVQTLTGILQGIGKQGIPVINLAIGAVVKIVITYNLTGIYDVNVKGAAIGTVVAYFIAAALDLAAVMKYTKVRFEISLTYIRPALASVCMAITVRGAYKLFGIFTGNTISTLAAILFGVLAYIIFVFVFKALTVEDLMKMPKGQRLIKFLPKSKHQ